MYEKELAEYKKKLKESGEVAPTLEQKKSKPKSTPKKPAGETTAGSGSAFKSKEFISDSSSDDEGK